MQSCEERRTVPQPCKTRTVLASSFSHAIESPFYTHDRMRDDVVMILIHKN